MYQLTTITATCPHCGFTNHYPVDRLSDNSLDMVICDCEKGGCDRDFVIRVNMVASVETAKIKWNWEYDGNRNLPKADDTPALREQVEEWVHELIENEAPSLAATIEANADTERYRAK